MYECVRYNKIIVFILITIVNRIGGVIVSEIVLSTLNRVKPNNIKLHTALRRKNTDWLARNHDSSSEWSKMSASGCCSNEQAR